MTCWGDHPHPEQAKTQRLPALGYAPQIPVSKTNKEPERPCATLIATSRFKMFTSPSVGIGLRS